MLIQGQFGADKDTGLLFIETTWKPARAVPQQKRAELRRSVNCWSRRGVGFPRYRPARTVRRFLNEKLTLWADSSARTR